MVTINAHWTGATSLGTKDVASGSVPNSNTFTFGSTGTYYFWAVYSGDANNTSATSGCDTEIVVVNPNTPTITTQVKNDAHIPTSLMVPVLQSAQSPTTPRA